MTPDQRDSLIKELEDASRSAHSVTEGLSDPQLTTRPASGGWSVAECLQHLVLTAQSMNALIAESLTRARPVEAAKPGRLGFMGWMLIRMLEPGSFMKSQTAAAFVPGALENARCVPDTLKTENDRLIELVRRAAALDLSKEKIESPFRKGVFYSPYAAFRIIAVHERRHIFQARQARPKA